MSTALDAMKLGCLSITKQEQFVCHWNDNSLILSSHVMLKAGATMTLQEKTGRMFPIYPAHNSSWEDFMTSLREPKFKQSMQCPFMQASLFKRTGTAMVQWSPESKWKPYSCDVGTLLVKAQLAPWLKFRSHACSQMLHFGKIIADLKNGLQIHLLVCSVLDRSRSCFTLLPQRKQPYYNFYFEQAYNDTSNQWLNAGHGKSTYNPTDLCCRRLTNLEPMKTLTNKARSSTQEAILGWVDENLSE